jgi:hypothetical protein
MDWKAIVTLVFGLLLALNAQFHWVSADVQTAIISVLVALGLWTAQVAHAKIEKLHQAMLAKK